MENDIFLRYFLAAEPEKQNSRRRYKVWNSCSAAPSAAEGAGGGIRRCYNCRATLTATAITVKITRYLPRVAAEILHCGGLHYFLALREYEMRESIGARARALIVNPT